MKMPIITIEYCTCDIQWDTLEEWQCDPRGVEEGHCAHFLEEPREPCCWCKEEPVKEDGNDV